jgi:hypothetical protein
MEIREKLAYVGQAFFTVLSDFGFLAPCMKYYSKLVPAIYRTLVYAPRDSDSFDREPVI